jgi:elongation factor G
VAVAKLKETVTGDTLCDENRPGDLRQTDADGTGYFLCRDHQPEKRATRTRSTPRSTRCWRKTPPCSSTAIRIPRRFWFPASARSTSRPSVERIKRKFGVEMQLELPKVPYRETIKGKARVQGKHKKQTGGHGQFADSWIEIEPQPRGGGFIFEDKASSAGSIPRQYIPAVEKGVIESCHGQGSSGRIPHGRLSRSPWWTAPSTPWTPRKWPSRSPAPWPSARAPRVQIRCCWSRS